MLHYASVFFLISLIAAAFGAFAGPDQLFVGRLAMGLAALGVISLGVGLVRRH